jgi:hypothetical protein
MKSTKNWSKGFSKNLLLAAMAALVLTFGLVVVGCDDGKGDDDGDKGKTVTFTLAKVDEKSFTITVDGAKWNEDVALGSLIVIDGYTVNDDSGFDIVRIGTVITVTRKSSSSALTGKINFNFVSISRGGYLTDGGESTGTGGSTTYVDGTPGGITFP